MESRKLNTAKWGTLVVIIAQAAGQLLTLFFPAHGEQIQGAVNVISAVVGALCGAVIAGTAHEDAAQKRNTPPVVLQQHAEAATQQIQRRVQEQVQTSADQLEKRVVSTLDMALQKLHDAIKR